jgi:hypothetical protein
MDLTTTLLTLALSLPGASYAPRTRVIDAVDDAVHVVGVEKPLAGLDAEQTARLLVTWGYFEAAWKADAVGDGGRSIGVMQVNSMWLGPHKVADVLASRRLGFRLGLAIMRQAIAKCGSVKSGLGAFASGKCGGAQELVERRCKLSGAC